ncbi:uncharacterized protein TNCV_1200141 [Trichonephila clavipes]|uniref:Uncharacterized protein n=1 Tax=Trichonephila clavipes TaxID=2585209 RepID=A0A8X6S954_TRICX|nr:uncharacterized protein TNCV_1200141 [Trichonephila clavipes]
MRTKADFEPRSSNQPPHDVDRASELAHPNSVRIYRKRTEDPLAYQMQISSRVGRNQTTVMRICDRWMEEDITDRRGLSHPPQCTISREDGQIVRFAVRQ